MKCSWCSRLRAFHKRAHPIEKKVMYFCSSVCADRYCRWVTSKRADYSPSKNPRGNQ